MQNSLREMLAAGGSVIGTFVSLPDPGIVEAIGRAGYDFVLIDMEHSSIDVGTLRVLLMAADSAGVAALVRVGTLDPNPILRVLDSGAGGVVAPHVCNHVQAAALVQACRYPPGGSRGVLGASRAAAYGLVDFADHARRSDEAVLTVALIEDPEGVEQIDAIVAVDGLDVVIPGAGDLSAAMGYLGQPNHPVVRAQMDRVVQSVRGRRGPVLGCHIMDPAHLGFWRDAGARLIIYSQDTRVLAHAYRSALSAMREQLPA